MIALADTVEYRETINVLEAIFVEAALIKEHQPKYNVDEKDNKSFLWVAITDEAFPAVRLVRGRELALAEQGIKKLGFSVKRTYGPFQSGALVREALKLLRKIFPYRDEKCTPLEEGGVPRPCFNYQLGLCPGMCVGAITKEEYGKTIRRLGLFLGGNVKELQGNLEKEMKEAVRAEEFERASTLKRTLYALSHISDISLLKQSGSAIDASGGKVHVPSLPRIEAYDVAHTGGKNAVGVMVVLVDGEPAKSKYRTFKLRQTIAGDDVGGLKEILSRRLTHEEWGIPDCVVIDGGVAHERAAKATLARFGLDSIPVVTVTKNDKHRVQKMTGDRSIVAAYEASLVLANAEAHRFSLARHKRRRAKAVFGNL
jgi:excinuclease ABC subunit C